MFEIMNAVRILVLLNIASSQKLDRSEDNDYHICVKKFCLPKDYDKNEFPRDVANTEPIKIRLEFNDLEVLHVNDKDFTVTLKMYLGVHWNEPRMISIDSQKDVETPIDLSFLDHVWLPDLEILHLKEIKGYKVLTSLAGLWVYNETTLFYTRTVYVTMYCSMRFDLYPLDTQKCKFEVGSYTYDTSYLKFETILNHDSTAEKKTVLDYDLQVKNLREEDSQWHWEGTNKNYSLGGFEMKFQRHTAKYVVEYYFPSGLFVATSWVSFLIDPQMVAGRMSLLVTLFLVLINMFNSVIAMSPNVEGFSAISTWIISCILFVFSAILGYAGILCNMRVKRKVHLKKRHGLESCFKSISFDNIDATLFTMFPIMFLFFNMIYWNVLN